MSTGGDGHRAPTEPAPRPHFPAALITLALAASAAVFALYAFVVRTSWGQRLDEHAFAGHDFLASRTAQAKAFLEIVSVGTLVLATLLIAAVSFARRRPRLAILAAVSIAGSLICTELLKLVVFDRPALISPTLIDHNSYPSGHTTVGMAIAVAAMLVAPRRALLWVAVGAGMIGAAFGVAVVAAGWHRPSDAIGSFLVVLAVAALCAAVAQRAPDPADRPGRDGTFLRGLPELQIGPAHVGLLAAGLCGLGLAALAALSYKGIPWTSTSAGFLLSALTIVVAAFATTLILAVAMIADERRKELPPGDGLR